MTPRVLVFAGSDPLAYSGLEADVRHLHALGCEASSIPTARTRQSVDRVLSVEPALPDWIGQVAPHALRDSCAVKIGMLHRREIVSVIASVLDGTSVPVVCDPVLGASDGSELLDQAGRVALLEDLLPSVTLVTPNLDELRALVPDVDDPESAAGLLIEGGAGAVLIKGGHGADADVVEDVLVTSAGETKRWTSRRVPGVSPRGTGCALSSAIAAGLASGRELGEAVEAARELVHDGIVRCLELGTRFLTIRCRSNQLPPDASCPLANTDSRGW